MRMSARELNLYTSMRGCGVAAKAISEALTLACRKLRNAEPRNISAATRAVGEVYYAIMNPVLASYAHMGAHDTEPRNKVAQVLIDEAKRSLGLCGYYPELGDAI